MHTRKNVKTKRTSNKMIRFIYRFKLYCVQRRKRRGSRLSGSLFVLWKTLDKCRNTSNSSSMEYSFRRKKKEYYTNTTKRSNLGPYERRKNRSKKKTHQRSSTRKTIRKVQEILGSVHETRNLLTSVVDTVWNEFYETIWKKRFNRFCEWEKSQDISTKKKKNKKEATEWQSKAVRKVIPRLEKGKIKKEKRVKEKKEVEKKEIEIVWRNSVRKLISSNKRPYWNGLKG